MSGQHVKPRSERAPAFRPASQPKHRASVERVIAQTPLYSIVEDTLTGETHTVWAVPEPVEL